MSTVDNRSGWRQALRVLLFPAIIAVAFVVVLVVRGL